MYQVLGVVLFTEGVSGDHLLKLSLNEMFGDGFNFLILPERESV